MIQLSNDGQLTCSFSFWQICYFFYKNVVFGITLFLYEAQTSFSGQPAYNDWFLSLYNVFFTSLPAIALGVFDQDVSARFCLRVCLVLYIIARCHNVCVYVCGVLVDQWRLGWSSGSCSGTALHSQVFLHMWHPPLVPLWPELTGKALRWLSNSL